MCQHCNSFNWNISGHFERIGKGGVEQSEVYKVSFNPIVVLFFCFVFSLNISEKKMHFNNIEKKMVDQNNGRFLVAEYGLSEEEGDPMCVQK